MAILVTLVIVTIRPLGCCIRSRGEGAFDGRCNIGHPSDVATARHVVSASYRARLHL